MLSGIEHLRCVKRGFVQGCWGVGGYCGGRLECAGFGGRRGLGQGGGKLGLGERRRGGRLM